MTATEPPHPEDDTAAAGPLEQATHQDGGRKQAARHHLQVLLISVAILALSLLLGTGDGRATDPLSGRPLPTLCFTKRITSYDCPGCGLSRCFIAMAHGRLEEARHYHPVGMAMFVLLVAQLPYRGYQLWRLARRRRPFRHRALSTVTWVLIGSMLVQWLLKMTGLVDF